MMMIMMMMIRHECEKDMIWGNKWETEGENGRILKIEEDANTPHICVCMCVHICVCMHVCVCVCRQHKQIHQTHFVKGERREEMGI
jgi:hypothetical protein